jgi:hypothetical protein
MEDDVRQILETELSVVMEPQLGTLVQDSLRQGRRMRAMRRMYGSALMAGSLVVVAGIAAQTGAATPITQRLAAAAAPAGRTAATPSAVLEVLLKDLPEGRTSHYAKAANGDLHVQAFLDDGSGPGLVRLALLPGTHFQAPPEAQDQRTWTLPSGNLATVSRVPGDCLQSLHVHVQRTDGLVASVDVGSCLAWSGFRLGHGRIALTQKQALAIADDPRLGLDMSSQLVKSGAKRFQHLAEFT